MSVLSDDLRRSAASNLRQAESSVRQGGPTAFVGEAYSLRKAADLHSKAADELDAKDAIIAELVEALKWSRVGRAPTRLIKGQNDEFWDSWHKTEDLIAKASQD